MAIVNLPLYHMGVIWKNEDCVVPVSIVDQSDNDVSGFAFSGVNVLYNRESDSTNQVFAPSAGQWKDKGRGLYAMTIPLSIINQEGCFEYVVEPTVTGYKTFRAAGRIERRPEDRVLNAVASGYNTTDSIGDRINTAGQTYEAYGAAAYDSGAQTLTWMVWLEKNGAKVLLPTSCEVKVIDASGATVMDGLSASPDALGMFKVVGTTIVLAAKQAYKVEIRVTYNGVAYKSGEGMQSFN